MQLFVVGGGAPWRLKSFCRAIVNERDIMEQIS